MPASGTPGHAVRVHGAVGGRFLAGFLCAAALLGGGAQAAPSSDPRTIALVDQDGSPFRILDLVGEPTFITFVATRCADACPIANAVFSKLDAALRRDRVRARLLTITLDPAYDTPYVMAAVARRFKADPQHWRFASGRAADIERLMAALGVVARPDKNGIPEEHSSFIYVLDRRARLAKSFLLSSNFAETGEDAARQYGG